MSASCKLRISEPKQYFLSSNFEDCLVVSDDVGNCCENSWFLVFTESSVIWIWFIRSLIRPFSWWRLCNCPCKSVSWLISVYSRLWWTVALLKLDFSAASLLHLISTIFLSRVNLRSSRFFDDDDNVHVHFSSARVPLDCEYLSTYLCSSFFRQCRWASCAWSNSEVISDNNARCWWLKFASTLFSMSLNLEVSCTAVRLVVRAAAISTCSHATRWCSWTAISNCSAGNARHCNFVSSENPWRPESGVGYWKKNHVVILEILHVLFALVLLGESYPGLSVPCEEQDFQDLEKMERVRAEQVQFSLDLHHRRPRRT